MLMTVTTAWAQTGNWDAYKASGYAAGSGTQADPYIINTAAQLAYFAANVTSGKDMKAYVELGDNIDLSGHWWLPIGNRSGNNPGNSFSGHFDGKGYTISHMTREWGGEENSGFFSFIKGGSVKNLTFTDAYLTNNSGNLGGGGARRVGVLAGATRNSPVIENIIVRDSKIDLKTTCTQQNAWDLIGGLVGGIYDTPTFANCYVDVDIDLTNINNYSDNGLKQSWFALFLGAAESNSNPTIKNVFAVGTLKVDQQRNFTDIAPILGHNGGKGYTIDKCYYVNTPTTADGSELTSAISNGEGRTTDFLYDFQKLANEYIGERTDLQTWNMSNGVPTYNTVSMVKNIDKENRNTVLSVTAPENSTITWTVDQEGADYTISSDKLSLSVPFNNKREVTGKVTIEIKDESGNVSTTKTLNFTIAILTYSEDLYADSYGGGSGTKDDPYLITNDLELAKLAYDVNNATSTGAIFSGKYFKLTQDIDLSDALWKPVGTTDYKYQRWFAGKLDGDGHAIKNMRMLWNGNSGTWVAYGFFAYLKGNAANEAGFCSVTNLVIDNASLEKATGSTLLGNGMNIGTLVGEMNANVEISNIIIRNSRITDNDETYTASGYIQNQVQYRLGGVIGNVGGDYVVRVFNIAADVDINVFKNGDTGSVPVYMGGIMASCESTQKTDAYHIYPTNLYFLGEFDTKANSSYNFGTIVASSKVVPTTAQQSTYFYANAITEKKSTAYGSQKDAQAYGFTFANTCTAFIYDKGLNSNHYYWTYSKNQFAFTTERIEASVSQTVDKAAKKVTLTLGGNILDYTTATAWTVDGKPVTAADAKGLSITFPLKNTDQEGTVTINFTKDGEAHESTVSTTITPLTYSEDLYADSYASGTGTKEDPYIISNDLELAKLARDVNNASSTNGIFSGTYFKLSDNIDLGSALWKPVGTTNYINQRWFAGKLNGAGKTIKNMRICWDGYNGKWTSFGMFAYLKGNAANEAGFCTVTNFILDNARIEKVKGATVAGQGTNIALIAGETSANVELSNIIIRNGVITDNEESYSAPFEFRYGSLIGNVNGNNVTRIFNISVGVDIDVMKNATTNGKTAYIAGLIGQNGTGANSNSYHVFPTNIYVHKATITTNESANYRWGAITASSTANISAFMQSTWYYADTYTGSNVQTYGTQKVLADFSSTFVQQNNLYIQNNNLDDLATWVYSDTNGFDYGSTTIDIIRGESDVLTATTPGHEDKTEKYYWYVSTDRVNWTKITDADGNEVLAHTCTLPYADHDRYVYAELEDGSSVSNSLKVPALRISATLDSKTTPGTYTVKVTNNVWTNNDYLDISYQWMQNNAEIEGATDASYTPGSSLSDHDKLSCHIIVKNKAGKVILEKWVYTATVVYLKPTDTDNTETEEARKADDSWGYSEDKPMLTWEGAYSKLEEKATWDENIIVLMGESSADVTNNSTNGFNIIPTYNTGGAPEMQLSDWEGTANSKLRRNATITSYWDEKDYNGVIYIGKSEIGLPLWGDTRFENITFGYTTGGQVYNIIYCQFNNLEMGDGVQMTGFAGFNLPDYGTIDGARTTSLQVFGGLLNDRRFYPLNSMEQLRKMEKAMPHGREGFTMTFKSGYYSAICAGSRQYKGNNGFMGTYNMPVKCTITMDINRTFNNEHNNNNSDYDAGIILAGTHEGAMFGDVDIVIKSGNIGRIVSGTLGAKRDVTYSTTNYGTQYMPYNTYMGRANILLDPENSETNTSADINGRINVVELYGGSAGRSFDGTGSIDNPFYGYSTIHIKGGTFGLLKGDENMVISGIFGAGAGGTNGIGNDEHYTSDERIPYWSGNDSIMLYGKYENAKASLIHYNCYNADSRTYTDVDPLKTNTRIIIDGGVFGTKSNEIDGIYGGGSGYMSRGLWSKNSNSPNKDGGNIYGNTGETVTTLTINGGTFYCKNGIFAGGRGTDYYYTTNAYTGTPADYTDLGKTYGNVELNINGGEFHCPVFGGGYGVADATLKDTSTKSTLDNMARIYGKSTVNINGGTFYDNIYGGGDMAVVEYEHSDETATNILIGNNADIRGSVFAGGNGRDANTTQSPEKVGKIIGSTSVAFTGDSRIAPYIYGDIYGGGNLAQVTGDTHVNIYAANFAGELFGGGQGLLNTDGTVNTSADVLGNTFVSLAKDLGGQEDEDDKLVDYFSINVIWNKMWDSENKKLLTWNPNSTDAADIAIGKQYFYDKKFLNTHNIYGGGNVACKVGTYDDDGNLKDGTGLTTVNVQKGTTPFALLNTKEWKVSFTDNKNPHFYVFGGGQGANTKVGSTNVTVDVEGDYGIYNAEVDDNTDQLSKGNTVDFGDNATARARSQAPKSSTIEKPVFDNSMGIPNFTILGVLGGGFAGTVAGNTDVTVDGKTFIHRVYGGGFGNPESADNNTTGQVGGNTTVYVKGAHIYGDVFGGGAGVQQQNAADEPFTNVARVMGTTMVEVSDDALVYGKVYGGGDLANVGEESDNTDYTAKPESKSVLNQSNGAFIKYEASGYKTFVNIIGGDIFGNVYGGGKGVKLAESAKYYNVGRINGNTLVHIANTNANIFDDYTYDQQGNDIPYVWNRIYGGCAYGTVDGNTLVHIEGGRLGLNIFGGGYGDVKIDQDATDDSRATSTDPETLAQVLGKKDTKNEGTYADILGNTKVQIDGGSWIWNQWADVNGNVTTWVGANAADNKICDSEEEFKQIVAAIKKAKRLDDITMPKAKAAIAKIKSDKDTQEFFDIDSLAFVKNHNIFGGGNRACRVGTYGEDGTVKTNTGDAVVVLNHSPLTDLTDADNQTISLLDCTTLPGLCWYLSYNSTSHPQFSVFGAGYGANTKVANAYVYARPGAMIKSDGSGPVSIKGESFRYLNQISDMVAFEQKEDAMYEDFKKVSKEDKKLYYGSGTGGNSDGTDNDPYTYLRYRMSRMAWSLGVPGLTFMEIHGGGFSGYVTGNTYVESDCELQCRNIYGAGLGAKPYGTITNGEDYNFGEVSGKSKLFIKSGYVAKDVYGGGAGVESFSNAFTGNKIVDFPNMAIVRGKTEVHIYGETFTHEEQKLDRTLIFGNVYGGGDVANVGTTEVAPEEFTHSAYEDEANHTSMVNIRGGNILSHVFAGGNGRTADKCADYTKLGGIKGNACLIIDRPVMAYPYCATETSDDGSTSYDPADYTNMRHPNDDTNTGIMPYLWNRVYGGCQNGTIYGNTIVAINNGVFAHNIFGGGWGNCDTTTVDNQQVVNITSADITGNTNMIIVGGRMNLLSYWLPDSREWEPTSTVDGITYSPQYNHLTKKFKINHNIYGGGNVACTVKNNTYLTMTKGMLYDDTQVVPGNTTDRFFESNEWREVYNKVGSPHFCVFGGGYGENTVISGNANINVAMARRGPITGYDIVDGNEYMHFLSGYSVMDIIGGGYSGKVEGDTHVKGDGGVFCRRIFGGGFYNTVNNTNVELKAIDCNSIFGGGLMGDVNKSTNITVGTTDSASTDSSASSDDSTDKPQGFTNKDIYIHGDIYGGNDVSGYVNVTLDNNGYFKDNGGEGTKIIINGGHIYGNVYGAGNGDYLYALDKKGNTKVTVNEDYPLNPNDPDSETEPLVYTVPMRDNMPSYKAASDAAKIVNINSWRPMTNKVSISIKGTDEDNRVVIKGDVYGGGNSATVMKVQKAAVRADVTVGDINLNIGSHVQIGRVFMGCNGNALFTASEDNDFMNKFQKLNGDVYDFSKELDLADTIDWMRDPSNKGISTLYLPTKNEDRPTVYPHLIDLYFQPVETDIQGKLTWNDTETGTTLEDCTIGTFCCGGNRGNMNVYPMTESDYEAGATNKKIGNVLDYTFPAGLTITNKIVGGCNNANYDYKGKATHEGGYLLGLAKSAYPFIKLNVQCKFSPEDTGDAYKGGNVYGGCYYTGTVRGDITIDLKSDMLEGKDVAKLKRSNELIDSNAEYSALNVYGAGYGQQSFVFGNTNIKVAEGESCTKPDNDATTFGATGTSANFIYGGGQQGNLIGVTNVEVFNGHIYKSVTGGSYSGNVWGSTHVKVGYPKYYEVKLHESGRYHMKRADQENKDIDSSLPEGKTLLTETIKQQIHLVTGDLVSQAVYDDIDGKYDSSTFSYKDITADSKENYFTLHDAAAPAIGWDKINIVIGEAVYGGGYSLLQSATGEKENTTVLKFNNKYNLDNAFTTNEAHIAELKALPGGTTAGFGGNTTILIADRTEKPAASSSDGNVSTTDTDRDHITISRQDMKVANVDDGQDLNKYYYKKADTDANGDTIYSYHYIKQAGKFYKGGTEKPERMVGDDVYEYDNEGGIFGDGHLSYAEGFRCADLTGYGFAGTTVQSPKILNTFQRMDILRLTDNCFSLLGARDYATDATDKSPYSISRVGEIQMIANNVELTADSALVSNTVARSRNYMGFANNVYYVGALNSNVAFTDQWHDRYGKPSEGKSYIAVKQDYIDNHSNDTKFEERNDGTAKNMIGIASGYALKVQNAQQFTDGTKNLYYGPVYGVIEMNLIDVREDEGGGYVYADNVHKRPAYDDDTQTTEDFLETTGNFVFPYKTSEGRFVVDDCFPISYSLGEAKAEAHYWYVTGFNYHYNAHITGYTFDSSENAISFESKNDDGIVALAGLKGGEEVKVTGWKLYSAHASDYDCDLEKRNYDPSVTDVYNRYQLYVGASNSTTFDGENGFVASLNMKNKDTDVNNYTITKENIPATLNNGDAKIIFKLVDKVNNNPENDEDYYKKHLSEPCKATLELYAPAMETKEDGTPVQITSKLAISRLYYKDADNNYVEVEKDVTLSADKTYYYRSGDTNFYQEADSFYIKKEDSENFTPVSKENVVLDNDQTFYCKLPRFYTYTIDLTIEYIQGPSISGNITIENCALPGERIRVRKNNVTIKADQAFSVNGYYWRIGKREKDANGKWRFVGDDKKSWSKDVMTTAGYDAFNQSDKEGKGLFEGCYYNQTEDYLEIPAYYFMNGYGIQLGVTMNAPGLNDIFALKIQDEDTLTVHNYHRMDPHNSKINLHLPQAIMRAAEFKEAVKKGDSSVQPFAEPRIYLSDQRDLTAFINFVDTIGTNSGASRYGANAQFVMLNDLTIANENHNGSADFAGTLHGNGHVISGIKAGNSLMNSISGNVYNLGLSSGKISNNAVDADGRIANYHCCYEYAPLAQVAANGTPVAYHMDGTADTGYSIDDFRYGRVAYDLNEYYLRARYSNNTDNAEDMEALKYVYDYYANGDYQYANRTDAITGKTTGITYLRTGKDSDLPNYEQAETRHDKTHAIDKARAQNYTYATSDTPESRTGNYLPLLNNYGNGTEEMNDFLFWGQSLQSSPALYPTTVASHQTGYMTNRVYRTAGYYGDTALNAFHYNAYERGNISMGTYVHIPTTTAIDFTCQNDMTPAIGKSENVYYPPLMDNATVFHDLIIKDGVTKNLLVYTDANSSDADNNSEAYDVAESSLHYDEDTKEALINGHHITASVMGSNSFATSLFHLVERDARNKNSEGDACTNNNLCVPVPFAVTNHAWYTRKPLYYADDNTGAWDGICLPFTVHKAVASLNGEITHFYGTPTEEERANPAENIHTLHHEYWLRGLTAVNNSSTTTKATFQRPGTADGLFAAAGVKGISYSYHNSFFVDTYEKMLYNKNSNPYYAEAHDYKDYLPLTANIPYIVRFPGNRYYEFDLSSVFYNSIIRRNAAAQSITFNAYGADNTSAIVSGTVVIPVTGTMETAVEGYSHQGTFSAMSVKDGSVYGMNSTGTAFDDASSISTIMPFRTYLAPAAKASEARRASVVYIAEASGIDRIVPETVSDSEEDGASGDFFRVIPIGEHRVRIESSRAMTLNVVTATGQLYRILDVRPGSAVYSGFMPGIYLFGNVKVMVQK